jgi:hypothetical protein
MWQAHLDGRMNEQFRLWGVLMFQSWLEAGGAAGAAVDEQPAAVATAAR